MTLLIRFFTCFGGGGLGKIQDLSWVCAPLRSFRT